MLENKTKNRLLIANSGFANSSFKRLGYFPAGKFLELAPSRSLCLLKLLFAKPAITLNNKGFIALMSAVIISAALMVAALSGSLAGFYHRDDELDAELKAQSAQLAEACANAALLQLSGNQNWQGNATTSVGDDACFTSSVLLGGAHATFQTRGIYQHAYTNLQVTLDTQSLTILSWQELPTFSF